MFRTYPLWLSQREFLRVIDRRLNSGVPNTCSASISHISHNSLVYQVTQVVIPKIHVCRVLSSVYHHSHQVLTRSAWSLYSVSGCWFRSIRTCWSCQVDLSNWLDRIWGARRILLQDTWPNDRWSTGKRSWISWVCYVLSWFVNLHSSKRDSIASIDIHGG